MSDILQSLELKEEGLRFLYPVNIQSTEKMQISLTYVSLHFKIQITNSGLNY